MHGDSIPRTETSEDHSTETAPDGLALAKVPITRKVLAKGDWCCISYAVRSDGATMPAKEVLDYLEEGKWPEGETIKMQVDEQVDTYARFLQTMQHFADHGEGDRYESMNGLDYGIFEFKAGRARIAFYDTPGDGTFVSKWKYTERERSDHPESPTWHIPDLDEHIRLCCGWPKKDRLAKESDIGFARKVRGEDNCHDK